MVDVLSPLIIVLLIHILILFLLLLILLLLQRPMILALLDNLCLFVGVVRKDVRQRIHVLLIDLCQISAGFQVFKER